MIISASRRTDIPAFFGDWFINRLKEGYFIRINPMNPKMRKRMDLPREAIDAIVFWTKNPKPFFKHLSYLDACNFNYYFQYTLNDYPEVFEPNVPSVDNRVSAFQELSRTIGAKRVVWRYDPIILSSITPLEYHLDKINSLAKRLNGFTDRLIISFLEFYAKVSRRLNKLEKENGINFKDLNDPSHRIAFRRICKEIQAIAKANNLTVYSCAETLDLEEFEISHGSCIDGRLINDLFNLGIKHRKDKSQRNGCLCVESVDVGMYNTCTFACSYCYASRSEKSIAKNLCKYDVTAPALIWDKSHSDSSDDPETSPKSQMNLF